MTYAAYFGLHNISIVQCWPTVMPTPTCVPCFIVIIELYEQIINHLLVNWNYPREFYIAYLHTINSKDLVGQTHSTLVSDI